MTLPARQPLAVFIITRNEEKNIERALRSVAWADECLVVDSGSTDTTVARAEKLGARVEQVPWAGSFGEYKEKALRLCTHEWVLLLDADEAVSGEMAGFIKGLLAGPPDAKGYAFRRRTYFGDRWVRGLGWYPDYVVRLFPKSIGRISPDKVHEQVLVDGEVEYRPEHIEHYSYTGAEQFRQRQERYAQLWAENAARKGRRGGWLALRRLVTFFRCYVLKRGFVDGATGLLLSKLYADYTKRKYEILRELRKGCTNG